MKITNSIATIIGYVLVIALVIPATLLVHGLVLQQIWEWFIVTKFDLAGLGLGEAIGLSLVISFITHQFNGADLRDPEIRNRYFAHIFTSPLMTLAAGFVVHSL